MEYPLLPQINKGKIFHLTWTLQLEKASIKWFQRIRRGWGEG